MAEPHHSDDVGTLGEEAVKLLRALAEGADGSGRARSDADPAGSSGATSTGATSTAGATPTGEAGEQPGRSEHVCTTGWCPVCRAVGFVKDNPEVMQELSAAATHLAGALRSAFEAAARSSESRGEEERP